MALADVDAAPEVEAPAQLRMPPIGSPDRELLEARADMLMDRWGSDADWDVALDWALKGRGC